MVGSLVVGRFRIVRELGAGAFGETFLAQDVQKMNAQCVVKRLITPNDPAHIDIVRQMFEKEAKKLNDLDHQGIPKLIAYFENGGEFYLVQDFVDGNTLDKEINPSRKWTEAEVTAFLLEVLEILAYVHKEGSIHRDLKPNNMMRRKANKKLVLIDFGAVREVRQTTTNLAIGLASGTVTIGTPGYMPAEQTQGTPSFASDVYAIGCISIEALICRSPYPSGFDRDVNTGEFLWRHRTRVSDGLAAIIDKMVCYDWRQRYRNAGEALDALQALSHNVPQSPPKTPPKVPPKSAPQTKTVIAQNQGNFVKTVQTNTSINPSGMSTRRKFIIGLAVATPLAIVAWDWWNKRNIPVIGKSPSNPPLNPSLQTQTLNNIITVNASGQEVSRTSSTIQYFAETLNLPNGSVPLEMALIPQGSFDMGMPAQERQIALENALKIGDNTEKWLDASPPVQKINFPNSFYMGRYAVTQAQWLAVMGKFTDEFNKSADAKLKGDNRPMIYVSWHEAREFCKKLTSTSNRGTYRLPTEAEWEYACRAGTTTPFHFGETITPSLVNYGGNQTVDVNGFTPNAWGLHQIHGNVWEWCLDEFLEYSKKSSNLKNNGSEPYGDMNVNQNDNRSRALRGGSWFGSDIFCRSAFRGWYYADSRSRDLGFRVVV